MSALGSISIKTKDGVYKNYTISIVDETNEFGQNISMFEEQTKEQRLAGEKRKYIGNGRVFWTDGNITKATINDYEGYNTHAFSTGPTIGSGPWNAVVNENAEVKTNCMTTNSGGTPNTGTELAVNLKIMVKGWEFID